MPLATITRRIKGSTARHANQILGRTGKRFWKEESFDRWMRNTAELTHFRRYILHNHVLAGLVTSAKDWLWCGAGGQAEPPLPPWT